MNLAPIALFVYNRLRHTRETVQALAQNELAGASDLFVFSDGPRSEAARQQVAEVRRYLGTVTGFRTVTVVEREQNLGCARSISGGVTEIVNRFGSIIVVEDDIVTSPFFLSYMNQALELYRDEDKVACIHGYLYPVDVPLPETFFVRGADIWGWGTWKRAWDLYRFDAGVLLKELKARGMLHGFDFEGCFGFSEILKKQSEGKVDTWDAQWYASAFLHDMVTLYPGRSLTRNIGHDNSGTHCSTGSKFDVELSAVPIRLEKLEIKENLAARQAIGRFHRSTRSSLLQRIKNRLKKTG